ncbi:MAG TPA: hypothetical protein VLV83_01200 [Acidobacteriota bacterium]|nr:hypothetical protein [Acidobacteriota bacterium]
MSKYEQFRLEKLDDYPLDSRRSKVSQDSFARPLSRSGNGGRDGDSPALADFFASLPRILAVNELFDLAQALYRGRGRGRGLIWGFGGHVIKVGLAPVLIDLLERGYVTALATNGAGIIHDFEIGLVGHTSEEVEKELETGAFGMARETGEMLNQCIRQGNAAGLGLGESVGKMLDEQEPRYGDKSLLLQAYRRDVPVTVHVAIGTDIIHNHPLVSGAALGESSLRDFRILTRAVADLDDGGVYVNVGSAVLLPEVFLKCVSVVRNAGHSLQGFTTANMDFIQHYRPTVNVVGRPVQGHGRGIALTGHHEIMLPLLAALLTVLEEGQGQLPEQH